MNNLDIWLGQKAETSKQDNSTQVNKIETKSVETAKKKSNRGGAREGAGRKKIEKPKPKQLNEIKYDTQCRYSLPEYRGGAREGAGRKPKVKKGEEGDLMPNPKKFKQEIEVETKTLDTIIVSDTKIQSENLSISHLHLAADKSDGSAQNVVGNAQKPLQQFQLDNPLIPVVEFNESQDKHQDGGQLLQMDMQLKTLQSSPDISLKNSLKPTPNAQKNAFFDIETVAETIIETEDEQIPEDVSQVLDDGEFFDSCEDLPKESVVQKYLESVQFKLKDPNSPETKAVKNGQFWINPSNPIIALSNQIDKGGPVVPDVFYFPRVFVFFPDVMFPWVKLPCSQKDCPSKGVSPKGYPESMRRIVDLDSCYYLATRRYKCDTCGTHFNPLSPDVLAQLPVEIQLQFPCLLSKKSGLDLKLLKMCNSMIDQSMGPQAVADHIQEMHCLRFQELEVQYYGCINTLQASHAVQPRLFAAKIDQKAGKFSSFNDQSGYAGFTPSGNYILDMFKSDYQRKKKYYDLDVQRRGGSIVAVDHSHKWTKHLMQLNGQQLFEGLFTLVNEFEEIRSQFLVQSVSNDYIKDQMIEMIETYKTFGHEQPKVLYTDKCCPDRKFYESVIASLRLQTELQSELPSPKTVVYLNDYDSASVNSHLLFEKYQKESSLVPVGFDCEWKVADAGGKEGKVSLLQLAFSDGTVYLFHLSNYKQFPQTLKRLLESDKFFMIGRSIGQDVKLLFQDYGVQVKNILELSAWAKSAGIVNRGDIGLAELTKRILGYTLDKGDVRQSDWSKSRLNVAQKNYAAKDALAGLLCYLKHSDSQFDVNSTFDDSECLSPVSELSDEEALQVITRVLLDPYHAAARIPIPKNHVFAVEFCRKFRDALFLINPDDQNKLHKYAIESGEFKSFDELFAAKPDWVLKRVRRQIPPPDVLRKRLDLFFEEFQKDIYIDPRDGTPLLNEECVKQWKNLIVHVDKGCLSDPVGIELYYATGKDQNGLTLYRCIRGTSDLEGGIHQKLVRKFKTWNAGPAFADAALAIIRHRYNIRASIRHRAQFPDLGHYDHYLVDLVQKLSKQIYGEPVHQWWNQLTDLSVTPEQFGIVPCIPRDQYEDVDPTAIKHYLPSIQYLAIKTKSIVPHLPVITKAEREQFQRLVQKFLPQSGNISKLPFDEMVEAWNNGTGCKKPDGIDIFKKISRHLELFMKDYTLIVTKGAAHSSVAISKKALVWSLNADGSNSNGMLPPAVAQPIPHKAQFFDDSSTNFKSVIDLDDLPDSNGASQSTSSNIPADNNNPTNPLHLIAQKNSVSSVRMPLIALPALTKSKSLPTSSNVVPSTQQVANQYEKVNWNNNKQCKNCLRRRYDNPGCMGGTARGTCYLKLENGEGKKQIKSKKT